MSFSRTSLKKQDFIRLYNCFIPFKCHHSRILPMLAGAVTKQSKTFSVVCFQFKHLYKSQHFSCFTSVTILTEMVFSVTLENQFTRYL
jgi:hypothetical protein